jgi:hypothetical protein
MTFSDLERTRWENGKYRYPEWRGYMKDSKAPREKPVDKDDHMMECMRRIVEYVWDYVPEPEKKEMVASDIDPMPRIYDKDGKTVDVNWEEETYDFRLGEERII